MTMAEDMLWIIVLACVMGTKSVNAYSFLSAQAHHTDSKTWKAASDRCGNNGLEFDEKVLNKIVMLQNKEFWIGKAIYRLTTSWIEILGCYSVPDGQETKTSPSVVSCQKQCESYQFFGYSESTKKCFCQHNHDNERSSYNISGCIEENDSNYSFVYKVFTGHVSDNGDGECTTLFCKTGSNGLKSANCYDATDTARISRCTEAGTKKLLYCLAGTITEKGVLHITRRACNDQLQFVCKIDEASTISNQSVITTTSMEKDSSASFNIGPVIGGIAGAIILLAVVFVMLFCKIRSRGFFKSPNLDKQEVQFST